MSERCGMWLKVADHETVCMRPYDHEGPCRPERGELIRAIDYHDDQADSLTRWITERDKERELWPYEGPSLDARPRSS